MRLLWLFMIVTLAAGSGLAFLWSRQVERRHEESVQATVEALERINREVRVRSAMGSVELNGRGWPRTVDPGWFADDPPLNRLVSGPRPWLEVASDAEADLQHPRVRTTISGSTAAFWYNPGKGVVRARVGLMLSDDSALELYNRVNGSSVGTLISPLPAEEILPPATVDAGE